MHHFDFLHADKHLKNTEKQQRLTFGFAVATPKVYEKQLGNGKSQVKLHNWFLIEKILNFVNTNK